MREGISELEIQKLRYFLQLLGAPLRLTFTRVHYGPYAEGLSHVLDSLEVHYLTGFGDRSARVTEFAPINATPGSVDAARQIVGQNPEDLARIEALLDLVGGSRRPTA